MQPTLILLSLFAVTQGAVAIPTALLEPASVGRGIDEQSLRQHYSATEWKALEDGAVVTAEVGEPPERKSEQRSVHAAALIAQPPELVWKVLTDFERRPQFLPGAKEIRVVRVEGNRVWLDERAQILLITINYRVINTLEPETGVMSWVLDKEVAHDIADSEGTWRVIALDGGTRTLVTYQARIDTGQPVPGFLESFLMKRSLPQLIEG